MGEATEPIPPIFLTLGLNTKIKKLFVMGFSHSRLEAAEAYHKSKAEARLEFCCEIEEYKIINLMTISVEKMGTQLIRWLMSHGDPKPDAEQTVRQLGHVLHEMLTERPR